MGRNREMHEEPNYTSQQLLETLEATPGLEQLSTEVKQRFARFMEMLLEASSRMNLTAIRDPRQIALSLFADSVVLLEADTFVHAALRGADIGSGAGFPVVPMAIALPSCSWTAIESIGKKCRFIEQSALQLGLKNLAVECRRAEEVGHERARESFDLVTAKAVGPVAALCEVGLPLLKTGGMALFHKTASAQEELEAARKVIELLGGETLEGYSYCLPGDNQQRVIFRIRKVAPTPEKYPRTTGNPFKKPLQL